MTTAVATPAQALVDGTTLEDPYLYIRNSAGQLLFENDDRISGVDRDSQVSFTAPSSGTYYIDVAAWTPTEPVPSPSSSVSWRG